MFCTVFREIDVPYNPIRMSLEQLQDHAEVKFQSTRDCYVSRFVSVMLLRVAI